MNIILIGPPGSGKGTQGRFLTLNKSFESIITGEMLRSVSKSGTELGDQIKNTIDSGDLVSDEMINNIISQHIENNNLTNGKGYLFDGYPRTVEQAEFLDSLLTIDKVIFLNVEEKILIDRIIKRGAISGRDDDKDREIIKTRMKNYANDTMPVIEYYKAQNKLSEINAYKSMKEVYAEILTLI